MLDTKMLEKKNMEYAPLTLKSRGTSYILVPPPPPQFYHNI